MAQVYKSYFYFLDSFAFLLLLVFLIQLGPLLVAFLLDLLQKNWVLLWLIKSVFKQVFLQPFGNVYKPKFVKYCFSLFVLRLIKILRKQLAKVYVESRI